MKKVYLLFIIVSISYNVLNAQNINDSLVYYYPFNGNANDASGHGYDGTVFGAILSTDRFGNPNSAYEFLGTDDYIKLPNLPNLKPQLPFSVSFWVYFNDLNNLYSIFTTDYKEPIYSGCWINLARNSNGDTIISMDYGDGGSTGSYSARRSKAGTTPIHKHTWYHVISVFRGPTDMVLYINCINDNGTYSGSGGSLYYSDSAGSIGRHNQSNVFPSSTFYLKGKVDDVKLWNRALIQKDIDKMCNPCYAPIDVSFSGLNSSYSNSDSCITLSGTPSGGSFYGAGMYNGTFCPSVLATGTYNIVYIYNNNSGCSGATCQSVLITEPLTSSKVNERNSNFLIYPNPANTKLIVEVDKKNTEITLTICNINGQELLRQQIVNNKTQINISNLMSGIYFVKLENDKFVEVKKIIKE